MLLTEMLLVALESIRANLFRAVLTMLGIIIGVASVITVVGIGSGARAAVDEQIEALGASVLSIRAGSFFRMGVAQGANNLTTRDADAVAAEAPSIQAVVPELSTQVQVKRGNRNENLRVVGVSPNFAEVLGHTVMHGELFTRADDAARRPVAVVGSSVPNKLGMAPETAVGETIYLASVAFRVVGVLEEKGGGGFRNVDEQVWIPLSTARYRVAGTDVLDVISARLHPGVPVERGIVDIERVMRKQHKLLPGRDNDFNISDPRQFLDFRAAAANIFAILLASVASVSLVVGGIGIMNIMLVTVTERTREIGVRKALGATRMNIMLQFVIEAMVLCMLGGLIGVALGSAVALLLSNFLNWQIEVSPPAIAIAFGFSAAVGLFFGIWPARKAARLDPIEALRHE